MDHRELGWPPSRRRAAPSPPPDQLRLRNIGGIITIDFIDMKSEENREKVYQALLDTLRADRSKTTTCKTSELGFVEMTRERVRESPGRALSDPAPTVRARASSSPRRRSATRSSGRSSGRARRSRESRSPSTCTLPSPRSCSARERRFFEKLETRHGMKVNISASDKFHIEHTRLSTLDFRRRNPSSYSLRLRVPPFRAELNGRAADS